MAYPDYIKRLCVFQERIYKLVDDPSTDSIISWSKSNNSKTFIIQKPEELVRRKMVCAFYSDTFPEFISMLKLYGFKEIKGSRGKLEFGNTNFVRGQPELLPAMHVQAVKDRRRAISEANKKAEAEAEAKKKAEAEAKEEVTDGLENLRI